MSSSPLARLAELHAALARTYAELARLPELAPKSDRALTLTEAAAMLGMSKAWLSRKSNWQRCGGYLDADRRVKFPLAVLQAHIQGRR